jgi:hypothetical protein
VPFAHIELTQADFLDCVAETPEPSLFDTGSRNHLPTDFDLIIANPPYVRTQVLGAKRSQQLAQTHRLSGRVDLFHAFVRKMTDHLRDGGVLALLCSNRFLSTQAGEAVRAIFEQDYQLYGITDLGDTKLFQAAVLPAVVIARKRPPSPSIECSFTRIYTAPAKAGGQDVPALSSPMEALRSGATGHVSIGESLYVIDRGVLNRAGRSSHAWSLSYSKLTLWLETVKAHTSCTFEDVAKIRVGIKTTADSVFIRSDWDHLPNNLTRPETQLLHPLITHHEARRWRATPGAKKVLYPHVDANGRALPIDLDHYPLAKAYLESHKAKLSARKYVQEAHRNWFEIWVPQRPSEWPKTKIVFPDIVESPRFLLDASGAIVNGDCYWMPLGEDIEEDLAYLLLAVGNSTFAMRYYDAVCGNRLYAGRRRFITQYVRTFPLPNKHHPAVPKIVGLVDKLVHGQDGQEVEDELDALVWDSFGLIEEASR